MSLRNLNSFLFKSINHVLVFNINIEDLEKPILIDFGSGVFNWIAK
jgi:hypothetical protein